MSYIIHQGTLYNFDLFKFLRVKNYGADGKLFRVNIEFVGVPNDIESDAYKLKIPPGLHVDELCDEIAARIIKRLCFNLRESSSITVFESDVAFIMNEFM